MTRRPIGPLGFGPWHSLETVAAPLRSAQALEAQDSCSEVKRMQADAIDGADVTAMAPRVFLGLCNRGHRFVDKTRAGRGLKEKKEPLVGIRWEVFRDGTV